MIEEEILKKIRPSSQERTRVNRIIERCIQTLEEQITSKSLDAHVVLTGSMAKDTWNSGDNNIDLFIIFSHTYTEKELKSHGLELGKLSEYEIAYAEHPYVRNFMEGYEIDVVPAFTFKEGIRSSVDRTPLHTIYVQEHLTDNDQVRLLKKFTRSIGVYGSDLKVEGVSGYLCELLVIHYGTFRKVLEAVAEWKRGQLLYVEEPPQKKFHAPLVFIDPVDPERNVAAVVSLENFSQFIYHAREYLKSPDASYFFKEPETYQRIEGTLLYRIDFEIDLIEDNLFPQLRKTRDFLKKMLETHGFRVFNSGVYNSGILLELSVSTLPPLKKHVGPPITEREHCDKFLTKHDVKGFQGERIFTITRRKYTTAHTLLTAYLNTRQGFGKDLKKAPARVEEVSGDIDIITF
ncbi:MAG: CCA tRNA nucleotidyltransferase [Theionarchaea archaeon]|nr:CCA tRNA nucleotidyltransferase [Theionarchaea archaeon]